MHELLSKLGISDHHPGACHGEWFSSKGPREIVSLNPTTGQPLASVAALTEADYIKVRDRAVEVFARWRMHPAPLRGEIVRQIGNELRKHKNDLGALISLEMGKIRAEGEGEVQEMIDMADYSVGLSRQLSGITMHSERPRHRMYEQWHPLGVVGIISAFNFPAAVWAWNAMIAAVCGDTMIWKPSSETTLTAIAIQNMANRVLHENGWDGVMNLCIGSGSTLGEWMNNDPNLPLISATGSTGMGKRIALTVSQRLGRTILELGGNNGIIVTPSADLDLTLRAVLFGAVGTAGQRCTTTRRLIMLRPIAEELTRRLVKAYSQVRIGDPLADGVMMGPLVNQAAVDDMMQALDTVRKQGGEVLYGGNRLTGGAYAGGFFVEPTIVKAHPGMDMVREETFAPILYLLTVNSMEEAIHAHNDVPQGLSSAIFTNNMKEAETFLSHLGSDCGIANVNLGTSGAEIGGAFGGEKETGGGREAGSDSWKVYMRRQTNTINWGDDLPLAQGIVFG